MLEMIWPYEISVMIECFIKILCEIILKTIIVIWREYPAVGVRCSQLVKVSFHR